MLSALSTLALRSAAAVGAVALLVAGVPATAAHADPVVPMLSGTVTLDTNANGAIDTATAEGLIEAGQAGVQIDVICVATSEVVLTTTSDAAGAWAFENFDLAADQLNCPAGVVVVRATVADDRYSITDAAGVVNETPRTADEQIGQSAPITLTASSTEVVNTLIRPDWYLDLTIPTDAGTGGPAVFTGTDPFDSVCPSAGNDCAVDDLTVRTADTVTFTWAVSGSSLDDLADTAEAVILEQTLNMTGGAIVNFARIPARCKPTGGGGATPASVIVDQDGAIIPEGTMPPAGTTSVTLRCNLGVWAQTGDAVTLQPVVKVSAESPNGSSFDTIARAYAVDPTSSVAPTAVPTQEYPYGPIAITAAPAYELEKKGFFNQDEATMDIGRGLEPGYVTYAVIQIKTNRRVGVEAFQQPVTITEDVFSYLGDGVTPNPGFEYAITQCYPNPSGWWGTVGGVGGPFGWGDFPREYTVQNSGTCAVDRSDDGDLTSDYSLTFDDIDLSGSRYPTKAAGEIDLTAGPYYVASWRVQIFIPLASIEATDGDPDNSQGSLYLYNRVGDFDPDGVSGASNFGVDREPGYCEAESVDAMLADDEMPFCDPSGTNTDIPDKSDNVIGPAFFQKLPPGIGFTKYFLDHSTLYSSAWSGMPGLTYPHSGDAQMAPGQVVDTHFDFLITTGQAPGTDARMCDVWDNSMAVLVPSAQTVTDGTDDIWAWLSPDAGVVADPASYNAKWIFEYAHFDLSADDPLSGGFDATSGRYVGDWTSQSAVRCDDDAPDDGWFLDPTDVPGGIDEVNAIRVRPGIDPDTGQETLLPYTAGLVANRLDFGVRLRNEFHGGPNDGEAVPAGAVFANFGAVRVDEVNGGAWTGRSYLPSPENGASDGDRVTISRATLALQKQTITVDGIGDGAAPVGNTGAAVAGNPIVWEVLTSVSAVGTELSPVDDLQITDVLPAYAAYDPDCTADIAGGTPADIVQYDTPSAGQTTLVWNLGEWVPNTPVPPRRICTVSDPLAPQGTTLVNSAQIQYRGSPTRPSDTHTVTLEQTGDIKLRKSVDAPLDVLNDDQSYTLSMQNFSQTLTVFAPTIIEVFPYNGDANPPGGVNRSPASSFSGALELVGEPEVTNIAGGAYDGEFLYTTDDPSTVDQNLDDNTSTWVTAADLAGDFSQVTAIKFVGADDLTPFTASATSGLTITFDLQAGDTADPFSAEANAAGDLYSNRFTAFSDTFTGADGHQILASNRVTVRTVSHSNGDLVFEDRDGNGRYTEGRDVVVPDGVTVNLYYESAGGDVLVDSTTTTDGLYLFTDLPPGDYHVEIPASQFASGGLLEGFSLTVAPAAGPGETAVDENDDLSHDAISGAGGSIVSHSFTLSATVDVDAESVTGDEPTGENLHGITDLTTTDPFSNLAIDLALQQDPGIDIEKEVCTLSDNSCDPAAALGEGGWSADGVDGVGPVTETTQRPYAAAVLWRIIVTNTGEQYLTDVAVTDDVTGDCAATDAEVADFADFAPGDVEIYTCQTASITANITPNTADVVGTPQGATTTLTDVDTANATTTGSLVINKTIDGPGAGTFGDGPFTFHVVCTYQSATVHESDVILTVAAGASAVTSEPIDGLPLGAECIITETDSGGADQTPPPVTVTIVTGSDENTVIAELTNTFSQATISLAKVLDGSAAEDPLVTSAEFTILVTCQIETVDGSGATVRSTLASRLLTIAGGDTVDLLDAVGDRVLLPHGARCFGEEITSGGATELAISHATFETGLGVGRDAAEQQLLITATNTFEYAEVVVSKVVEGSGSSGPYTFSLACTLPDGAAYPLAAEDAAFELSHGQSRTIQVLAGVECAVVETNAPAGAVVTWEDSDGSTTGGSTDAVVTATAGLPHEVTVTNTFAVLAQTGGERPVGIIWFAGGTLLAGLIAVLIVLWVEHRRRSQERRARRV